MSSTRFERHINETWADLTKRLLAAPAEFQARINKLRVVVRNEWAVDRLDMTRNLLTDMVTAIKPGWVHQELIDFANEIDDTLNGLEDVYRLKKPHEEEAAATARIEGMAERSSGYKDKALF